MSGAAPWIALADGRRSVDSHETSRLVAAEQEWLASVAGPDARHALLADNGIGWAIADLALHAARAVNVPLPGYFTKAQIDHALGSVGVDVILTDDPARVLAWHSDWMQAGISPASGLATLRRTVRPSERPALPTGTTKITFTSGSTGAPKGVCLDAGTIERVAQSLADVIAPLGVRRHLCLLPLATLLDNLAGLFAAPRIGAMTIVPPLAETGIHYGGVDTSALLDCIERHAPESLILVPELLRLLLWAIQRGWRAPRSLRFLAVGGAAVAPELLDTAHRLGLPVYQGYGLSECASVVTLSTPDAQRRGSVGRALPHARIRVDAHGELHVCGATMLGYLDEGVTTGGGPAEIATGDLGRIDTDGFVYVEGRAKNILITTLGRNVSPEWVERELLAQPAIGQAVVFGDARPWLFALLVPAAAQVTAADLATAVTRANRELPDYARVRRWQVAPAAFTAADGTSTPNGRPRRAVLAAKYAALIDAAYAQSLAS